MKLEYDETTNAAYIQLSDDGVKAAATVALTPQEAHGAMVNLDFDENDRLIGIEVLGAREHLPSVLLHSSVSAGS